MTLVRRVQAQKRTKQYSFVESQMEFILNPALVTYELDYYLSGHQFLLWQNADIDIHLPMGGCKN